MKTNILLWALAALAMSAAGCFTVSTVGPVYTPEMLVRVPAIEGVWESRCEDGGSCGAMRITLRGDGHYLVVGEGVDEGPGAEGGTEAVPLMLSLFRLGETLFADVTLPPEELLTLGSKAAFVLPLHTLARVEVSETGLSVSLLDEAWARRYLTESPGEVELFWPEEVRRALEEAEEGAKGGGCPWTITIPPPVIVTSGPERTRAFLLKHAENEDAWTTPCRYTRRAGPGE